MLSRGRFRQALISSVRSGPIGLEIWMAIASVRWAIFFALPTGLLANNMSGTMNMMAAYAPVWVWVTAFAALGLGQFFASILQWRNVREGAAFAGVLWWLMVTVFDGLTGFNSATIILCTFVLAELMIYWMLVLAFNEHEGDA